MCFLENLNFSSVWKSYYPIEPNVSFLEKGNSGREMRLKNLHLLNIYIYNKIGKCTFKLWNLISVQYSLELQDSSIFNNLDEKEEKRKQNQSRKSNSHFFFLLRKCTSQLSMLLKIDYKQHFPVSCSKQTQFVLQVENSGLFISNKTTPTYPSSCRISHLLLHKITTLSCQIMYTFFVHISWNYYITVSSCYV